MFNDISPSPGGARSEQFTKHKTQPPEHSLCPFKMSNVHRLCVCVCLFICPFVTLLLALKAAFAFIDF